MARQRTTMSPWSAWLWRASPRIVKRSRSFLYCELNPRLDACMDKQIIAASPMRRERVTSALMGQGDFGSGRFDQHAGLRRSDDVVADRTGTGQLTALPNDLLREGNGARNRNRQLDEDVFRQFILDQRSVKKKHNPIRRHIRTAPGLLIVNYLLTMIEAILV